MYNIIFNKKHNYRWSVKKIKKLIMREDKLIHVGTFNEKWAEEQAEIKAREIYQELNRLNKNMWNDEENYAKHNIPLSMFNKWGEDRI